MKEIGITTSIRNAIREYFDLIPTWYNKEYLRKEELLDLLQQWPSKKKEISVLLPKIHDKKIKEVIKSIVAKIDNAFNAFDLTYKQRVISEHTGAPSPLLTFENHIYPLDEIDQYAKTLKKIHQAGIISDIKRISPHFSPYFDYFFDELLKIYLKNTTIESAYAIVTGKKDAIYDVLASDIQELYNNVMKKESNTYLLWKITKKDDFGIDQWFLKDLEKSCPYAQQIKKPSNSFIRKTIKNFHKDFAKYIFGSEEFLYISNQFIWGSYVEKHSELKPLLWYTFVANYLFHEEMIYEMFSYYLQWTLFDQAHQSHLSFLKKFKLTNKRLHPWDKSHTPPPHKEKKWLSNDVKDFFQKFIGDAQYNIEIESYIGRVLNNKGQINLQSLNTKYNLGYTEDEIKQRELSAPVKIMKSGKVNKNDKSLNHNDTNIQWNEKNTTTTLYANHSKLVEEYLKNPTVFDAHVCIDLFETIWYEFANKNFFIKSFNDSFKESSGNIRKQQFLKSLLRHFRDGEEIWKNKSYWKLKVIEIKHEAYRLVKKNGKIMGIYNHNDYERNAYLWLK